jgi:hypothetical protein
MDDKLNPLWIMERLRELRAVAEREMQPEGWDMSFHMSVSYRPNDGSAGRVTFMVDGGYVYDDETPADGEE